MANGPQRLMRWMLSTEQPEPLDLDHSAQADIAWAADEIESLRAEVERLRRLLDRAATLIGEYELGIAAGGDDDVR